jgi:asparagine synthase (glutamine-hydrolysing)
MGFGVPLQAWFRSDLRDFAHDLFSSEAARTRGLFRDRFALDLLREHDRWGRAHTRLWALLMLELWFREWIDRPHPAVANGAVSASDRRSAEVKAIRATAQGS